MRDAGRHGSSIPLTCENDGHIYAAAGRIVNQRVRWHLSRLYVYAGKFPSVFAINHQATPYTFALSFTNGMGTIYSVIGSVSFPA